MRKNVMGIKKSFRRTFRKIFGETRKSTRKSTRDLSAKFITDMMSESSESEVSDQEIRTDK